MEEPPTSEPDSELSEGERAAALEAATESPVSIEHLRGERIRDLREARSLRKWYARWFLGILAGQLIAVYLLFVLVGSEVLEIAPRTLEILIGGTLAETFGIVFVIVRYLFSWV